MKRTQLLEILRIIRSTKTFCITMVVVTALSITGYTGISFVTESLHDSCEAYFDDYNLYDIQFGSVYGFDNQTIEEAKENENINDAEASYYTQELITIGQDDYVAEFYTQTENINKPRLVSGRFPNRDGECTVEQALLDRFNLKVGDTITLPDDSDMLKSKEYKIVGSADLVTVFATNDFYNRGTSSLGDGQVTTKIMVDTSAFKDDAVRQLCYVTLNNSGVRGSDEYFSYAHDVSDELLPVFEDAGQKEYERRYADYQQQIDDAQTEYDEKKSELDSYLEKSKYAYLYSSADEIQSKITDAEQELDDAKQQLDDARLDLADMPQSTVFSLDINANPSYYYYSQIEKGTDTIVATLCTLLMGIAILVCFTTISRMVTEEHRIIGTQKAMGFLPHEIYGKYIIYTFICTFMGVVLGTALSYFVMEKLVYKLVYGSAFILKDFTPIIIWTDTLKIAALEIAIMCLSAFLACRSMLKKSAITLLNSNIRDSVTIEKNDGKSLPLRVSMVLRNLRSNPQIMLTTIVSVMGCTILMVSSFTIHHGMASISDRQFNELQHYQGTLTLNKNADESDLADIREYIDDTDSVKLLPVIEKFVSYKTGDFVKYATLIGINPDTDASTFVEIRDVDNNEQMEIPDEGVLICRKMAENYGYSVGDEFILTDNLGKEYKTFVAGVFDRNIGMAIVTSPSYYAKLMDTDENICQYYVMGSNEEIDNFLEDARTFKAYCNYSDSSYYKDEMEFKVNCVNEIILVVLVITGLLSLFVLFNLAQMNIRKKEKDIVVMKVLGVPPERIRGYVFWEAMIMCTIGLILGVIVGGPVGSLISRAEEMENLQYIRGISIGSCLIGGAINLMFYTATNLLSLTGIEKIKMTGSAREA